MMRLAGGIASSMILIQVLLYFLALVLRLVWLMMAECPVMVATPA
jgi:hypothetical protein